MSKKTKTSKTAAKTDETKVRKDAAVGGPTPAKGAKAAKGAAKAKDAPSAAKGGPKAKTATKQKAEKPKRVSALDAAATVLGAAGKPMRAAEIVEAMATKGLWSSPNGKTPHATLHAALTREIKTKGKASRFAKDGRGLFAATGKGA